MSGTVASRRISAWEHELQALFTQWAKKNFPAAEVMAIGRCLGLDWKKAKHLEALMTCSAAVRDAVFAGRLHAENVAAFEKWTPSDQAIFLCFFQRLQLSLQTEREFLEWLPEIAWSGKKSIAAVLADDEISRDKNDTVLSAPQKIQKIRTHIFALRFPQYDAAMKKWKQIAAKTFGGTSGVSVVPSPYFEKNRLELRIGLSGPEEASTVLGKLAAIPGSTWEALINPMK
jgi:hypothetical protein